MSFMGDLPPIVRLFERWLVDLSLGERFVYHRGELARDCEGDPDTAAIAQTVRDVSNLEHDIVSKCGHVRGYFKGTGLVELVSRRERGELVHMARRRKADSPAGGRP